MRRPRVDCDVARLENSAPVGPGILGDPAEGRAPECRRTKEEGRGTRDEGRRAKGEGRRRKEEGRGTGEEGGRTRDEGRMGKDRVEGKWEWTGRGPETTNAITNPETTTLRPDVQLRFLREATGMRVPEIHSPDFARRPRRTAGRRLTRALASSRRGLAALSCVRDRQESPVCRPRGTETLPTHSLELALP